MIQKHLQQVGLEHEGFGSTEIHQLRMDILNKKLIEFETWHLWGLTWLIWLDRVGTQDKKKTEERISDIFIGVQTWELT